MQRQFEWPILHVRSSGTGYSCLKGKTYNEKIRSCCDSSDGRSWLDLTRASRADSKGWVYGEICRHRDIPFLQHWSSSIQSGCRIKRSSCKSHVK